MKNEPQNHLLTFWVEHSPEKVQPQINFLWKCAYLRIFSPFSIHCPANELLLWMPSSFFYLQYSLERGQLSWPYEPMEGHLTLCDPMSWGGLVVTLTRFSVLSVCHNTLLIDADLSNSQDVSWHGGCMTFSGMVISCHANVQPGTASWQTNTPHSRSPWHWQPPDRDSSQVEN